jgi:hypothetical protein
MILSAAVKTPMSVSGVREFEKEMPQLLTEVMQWERFN